MTAEELQKVPLSRDLKTILDYHNQLRAEVGAAPLRWNPALAAGAADYANELSRSGGELRHASREGRKTIRENLRRGPRGIYSPLQMVQAWGNEKRTFRPGKFPNVATDGNVDAMLHYTQMIWPTTTDVGCALLTDKAYDWLICRYSPPGNQDGFGVGPGFAPPAIQIANRQCNGPNGPMMCPGPDGEEEEDGGANDGGGAGQTTTRPPQGPVVEDPNAGLRYRIGDCEVGVLAAVRMINKVTRAAKQPYDLQAGFTEIVIPEGFIAKPELKPDPGGNATYEGTLTARWSITGVRDSRNYSIHGDGPKFALGKWDREEGLEGAFSPPRTPSWQEHKLWRQFDPDDPTDPPQCAKEDTFTVTFAGPIPELDNLDLSVFVGDARNAGFPGTGASGGTQTRTGTRGVNETQPRPYLRTAAKRDAQGKIVKDSQGRVIAVTNVVLPIGTYWDLDDKDCCDLKGAEKKVIQFARAAIHGPNGRLGKGWSLDILPQEIGDAPNHDPTYTSEPNTDGNNEVTAGGAGGTAAVGNDLLQWDAPGMPKDLYDRLYAAQGPSLYRQQFLSLLVCRPGSSHRVSNYLAKGRVCRVAITTVRWEFPGQRGIANAANYQPPRITVSFDSRDARCMKLKDFLDANGLTNLMQRPNTDSRNLEKLTAESYPPFEADVSNWEQHPFDGVRGLPPR